MAVSAEEIVTRLSISGRTRYAAELRAASGAVRGFARDTSTASAMVAGQTRHLGVFQGGLRGILTTGLATATVIGGLAVTVGAKLTDMTSDAYETQQKFDQVFKGLGSGAAEFVDAAFARFGIAKPELEDASSLFGVFAKSAKVANEQIVPFSNNLVQAGLDLGSFYNKDPTQVFNAIASGLAGNIRPLRQFGIFLSQSVVKTKAAELGMTGTLTDAQKVYVRYLLILDQLGDAHNDLGRTSRSLANQWRGLKGRVTQLAITFGQFLLPYAVNIVHTLNVMLGPAITRVSTLVERLGINSTLTAVHMSWIGRVADQMANIFEVFVQHGGMGVVDWLDRTLNTGGFFRTMIEQWVIILHSLGVILTTGVLPALKTAAPLLQILTINTRILALGLSFLATNAWLVRMITIILVGYYLILTVRLYAAAAATIALRAAELLRKVTTIDSIVLAKQQVAVTKLQEFWARLTGKTVMTQAGANQVLATTNTQVAVTGWAAVAPYLALAALFVAVAVGTYLVLDNFNELRDGAVDLWEVLWNNPFGRTAILILGVTTGIGLLWGAFRYGPAVIGKATSGIESALGRVGVAFEILQGIGVGVWNTIGGAVRSTINGINGVIESGLNITIDLINPILDFASHIPFNPLPAHIDHVHLPRLHAGGRVLHPGLVNLQAGEEVIGLPSGATVAPLPAGAGTGRGGGSSKPIIVQLQVGRKKLAEVVVDGNADREARR